MKNLQKNLRCALFDLDNTLYPNACGLWEEIGNRINLYMVERLGIDRSTVGDTREAFMRAFGTTLNALRRRYSVDPDEFLSFVHDIPLERYLTYDPNLDRMLERLEMRKAIFTNADAPHARRVLSRLGIARHFEWIVDIHLLEFINKPDPRSYRRAIDFVGARAEECLLLEDSMVNIVPAAQMGMTTVLVGGASGAVGAHHQIERITDIEALLSGAIAAKGV